MKKELDICTIKTALHILIVYITNILTELDKKIPIVVFVSYGGAIALGIPLSGMAEI